ncbi:uncharacterized protein [Palaemon carinicauda]|uniref:uncharacterized protein n=1 Tax=Palaemon carinicauda TaxID=392227 RepID=UPI0035B5994D
MKLTDMLIEFCQNRYAVVVDKSKAFLRIGINESHRVFTRFSWFADRDFKNVKNFRFKILLFGATCSPFSLSQTIQYHLQNPSYPIARSVMKSFDNFIKTYEKCEDLELENSKIVTYLSNLGNACTWTKRKVVSLLSTVFDPLGMLNPVTIEGKLFVKKLWELKTTWDGDLRINLKKEYDELLSQLKTTDEIRVPRPCFNGGKFSLHVFVDASQVAYGACAYAVNNKQTSHLLIRKSRVTPSPPLTIPRQELLALTVSTFLAIHLLEMFGDKISDCTVWSDSKVALSWVFYEKSKGVFVINRVKEIKDLKSNHNIRLFYVCTKENPADLVTRGISMSLLGKSVLWFHGPTWIIDQNQFPEQEDVVYRESVNVNEILAEPSLRVPDDDVITFNCSEFSSLKHALSIVVQHKHLSDHSVTAVLGRKNPSIREEDLKACILCKKLQNQPLSLSGIPPLPPERVKHEVPFACVGVDYTGNINVSENEAEDEKVYVLAIHGKHGLPRLLISDNAPNFIAAKTSSMDNEQDEEGEAESSDVGDDLESVAKDETTDAPPLQMTHDRRPMRRAAVKSEEHRKQLIRKGAL